MWKDGETWCVPQGDLTLGGKTISVTLMLQEVNEQERHDLTKNAFCEEQGECDDDVSQAGAQ